MQQEAIDDLELGLAWSDLSGSEVAVTVKNALKGMRRPYEMMVVSWKCQQRR